MSPINELPYCSSPSRAQRIYRSTLGLPTPRGGLPVRLKWAMASMRICASSMSLSDAAVDNALRLLRAAHGRCIRRSGGQKSVSKELLRVAEPQRDNFTTAVLGPQLHRIVISMQNLPGDLVPQHDFAALKGDEDRWIGLRWVRPNEWTGA